MISRSALGAIAIAIVCFLILRVEVSGQVATADIRGRVTDSTGGILPGATITVENLGTHDVRVATSSGTGDYVVDLLPGGSYSVKIELEGFTPQTSRVTLAAGNPVRVDATLQVGLTARVEVTARRRTEDLQEVPVSIDAESAEDLQAKSVQRLSDLGQVTPNLLWGQKIQSGSSAGQVYIRGIGQQDTNTAFSSGVGIYIDGVYLGRAQGNDLDMADVQRVEVLYGPQGTLFGKNSNGGIINVVTTRPDIAATRPSGNVTVQTGEYGRLDALGFANVPIVTGKAALQVSLTRRGQDGYSERLVDQQPLADQNRTSGRAQLLLKLTASFEAAVSFDGTVVNEHTAAYRLVDARETSSLPVLYAQLTPYRYDDRWVTTNDFQCYCGGPNKNSGNVWGTSATLSWERQWGTLKSISSFRKMYVDSEFDPDASPLTLLDVFNYIHQQQFSQEVQASGVSFGPRLRWVGGLYFFHEKVHEEQPLNIGLEVFHGAANFSPIMDVLNRNYAAYGQADFSVTPRLKLTAGGRLGNDSAEVGRMHVGYPVPIIQQPLVTRAANWTSFLPRVGVEYQWNPAVMTYVSAAEGSKSGGFNGRAQTVAEFNQFEPEKVWTYEAGLRSEWLDQRLRFNGTVFYSNYRDFQIQQNRSTTDPDTGQPVAFSFVGNMPRSRVTGGEFFFAAVPWSHPQISGSLGITDGKYLTVIPGAPVTTDDAFVNAPKYTVTASAQCPLVFGRAGTFVARADYVHKSTVQYDYGNSPLVAQDPYGLLNARLTWQPRGLPVSIFLFGTNLADVHYAVGGIDDSPTGSLGEVTKLMGPPREWGVGLQFRF
jgi:iron complex outermembrane receptor protein